MSFCPLCARIHAKCPGYSGEQIRLGLCLTQLTVSGTETEAVNKQICNYKSEVLRRVKNTVFRKKTRWGGVGFFQLRNKESVSEGGMSEA